VIERPLAVTFPEKRPRRAAYALPTLFTSANLFLGFLAIVQSLQGALLAQGGFVGVNPHFKMAAKALGFAVFFDGLDGRIARLTNTTSDFGRELDSLADVITFGIAPAVLAFVWGILFVAIPGRQDFVEHLTNAGYLVSFFFVLCGAVRLALFNVQTNPMPKNPGRPDRKYFVGMPIPAAAGMVAAVVFKGAAPVRTLSFSLLWLILLVILSLLMVSRWRYPSFKQISVSRPRTPLIVLLVGGIGFLIWNWPQPVLLIMAVTYFFSGILIRTGGLIRRLRKSRPVTSQPEHQVG